ncbi:MAG: N-acetylmuramoyl-L-alanine amidase [Bacteroidetes bacterium]|nr:N-acetylmuramoyl-L-alanine amidase [Bacteroidota bacterium]
MIYFFPCLSGEDGRESAIKFRLETGETAVIRSLDTTDVTYISLTDFLRPLHLPGIRNDSTKKIECIISNHLVRFTARNPFVVITDRSTNTASVYQMPVQTIRRNQDYYVPASIFATIFERVIGKPLLFNPEQKTLELRSLTSPYDIAGIEIERKQNGSLITILSNKKPGDIETWLKPDGWLFVTITGVTADTIALNNTKPTETIKKVLAFQSPTSIQLTFRVSPDVVQAEAVNDPASNNLFISLRTRSESERKELERKKQEAIRLERENARSRWKLDVIVIDPGHGGKDPGAIGVAGTYEKDITLKVALRLGKLIEENLKDVKVVYTRKIDKFVELYKRTQIANEAAGKLFISLHCNASPRKPSSKNGFEIYLLRPSRTEDAVNIAAMENSVIQLEEGYKERYRELTEEEFIIVTMAQSAYMKHSEHFAECAVESMADNLNIKNSGVKQAGFYVLVGASMPNVLVEIGYLSNRKEELFLRSQNGQKKIAEAILRGVKEYKEKYEKALQEGMDKNTD